MEIVDSWSGKGTWASLMREVGKGLNGLDGVLLYLRDVYGKEGTYDGYTCMRGIMILNTWLCCALMVVWRYQTAVALPYVVLSRPRETSANSCKASRIFFVVLDLKYCQHRFISKRGDPLTSERQ